MRQWLIDHGYLRSDAQKTRDDLIKLMQENYDDASAKTAAYLTWPDARLRAYLRENGVPEASIRPQTRDELLQEVRIRWYQDWKSTRLNSSHSGESRMPSSA